MVTAQEELTRIKTRDRVRRYRERKKAAVVPASDPALVHPESIEELQGWVKDNLIIPPGHPNSGHPFWLPDYLMDFFRDAMTVPEALLSIARKNAKTAGLVAYTIARLTPDSPIAMKGYRGGVCSVNREKAGEFWLQAEAMIQASPSRSVQGIKAMRSPRHLISASGRVDILSAEGNAGHASGFDDALLDELGLLKERDRDLVNGLRTSVSARGGRFVALSIQGDAPFTAEMLDRQGGAGLAIHHYGAWDNCELDDRAAWDAANPGISAGIKQLSYMEHAASRALAVPADAPHFRAFDLNQPQVMSGQLLVQAQDWIRCETEELPDRQGPMVLGIDLSGGYAMSTAVAYWPQTCRLEGVAMFPDEPTLKERGDNDGVGQLYEQMFARGELLTSPGKSADAAMLLYTAFDDYGIPDVIVCDRWKKNELADALQKAGINAPVVFRGMGWQDGSEDVRNFQRAIALNRIRTRPSLAVRSAMSGAVTVSDPAGNAKLAKGSQGGRRARHKDDFAAAAILAVSMGMKAPEEAPRKIRQPVMG